MTTRRTPATSWLLTPAVALAATVAGVVVLFYVNASLVPPMLGGLEAVCGSPDCGLGLGVWLIVGAFVLVSAALVAGVVVGVLRRHDADRSLAVRRGLWVAGWCLLAYVAQSLVMWITV